MVDPLSDFYKQGRVDTRKLTAVMARLRKHTQQRADLLALNKTFQALVERIRDNFNVTVDTQPQDLIWESSKWWQDIKQTRAREWEAAITALLTHCQLLAGWRDPLVRYIVTGVFEAPPALEVIFINDGYSGQELKILVNDYSNLDDLKSIQNILLGWREYWGYQHAGQIAQPIRKFKYYLRMLELDGELHDDQKIADQMNREFKQKSDPAFTKKLVHDDLAYIKRRIAEQMT